MKTLRLFISSPGDVGRERHATAEVIRRLQSEFAEHVTLDPYFWEWEPVDFSKDYQANIPSTADFDIVICILWSRLGSRLSDQHKLPPDYTRPASSGTEYELLQALHGQQQHPDRLPDLLVWKNDSPPPPASAPPLSREEEDERIRQRRALQDFLTSVTRDSATGSFIAALNGYTYLDEFEDMMDKKLRKLIQKHIGQRTVKPKPQWQGSPFRDLDVFEFEHAPIFFGRSRAVGEVVRLLQSTLSKPQPCHFALILGASGSGKSSLARAGVLPLLTRPGVIEGIGLWRCAIVRPSDDSADLFQALAAALRTGKRLGVKDQKSEPFTPNLLPALPELADPESPHPQQSLAAELRAHPQTVAIRVKDQLNAVAKDHQAQQRRALEAQIASLTKEGRQADAALKQQALQQLQEPKARLVLLVDQMEELFTLNYAPEQLRAFLETIDVLARSGLVFVIGTLRSDFYPRYQEQPTLVALARDGARFDLLPPTPDEISQIIRRPASLAALQFEPHPTTAEHTLADTLRDEALTDTEALPLLEHVLNRLFQAQLPRADGRLTFADYEEICGVDVDPKTGVKTSRGVGGALGKHAEDIFTGQHRLPTAPPPPWTEDTFRAVFRCLVTFGKGEGDTDVPNRRTFTYQDLIQSHPAAQALVDTFIHERLLIADTDAQSRPVVRLSHEALLTRWPRLSQWLQTAPVRDLMSQRRRLESSLRQWQEQNRTPDCNLQPGFELEEGKQLLEKHEAALKPEEREFIRASVEYHTERESKATRRRRLVIAMLSALTIIALVSGWYGWSQAIEANRQRAAAQTQAKIARVAALDANNQRAAAQTALAEADKAKLSADIERGAAITARKEAVINANAAEEARDQAQIATRHTAHWLRNLLQSKNLDGDRTKVLGEIKTKQPDLYSALTNNNDLEKRFETLHSEVLTGNIRLDEIEAVEDIISYSEAFAADKDGLDRLALYRLWLCLWKAEAKINTEAYREAINELARLTFPPSTSKNAQELVSIREQKESLMAKLSPKISKVEVSSTLPDQAGNSYGGGNAGDGKPATAWVAARNDDNPWIKFILDSPALVSVIEIIPGYGKSDRSFKENGSAKDIKVEFEDGTSKNFHLVRKNQLQPCIIDPPMITKSVKIQILSSYPGDKDVWVKDIPISTIELK